MEAEPGAVDGVDLAFLKDGAVVHIPECRGWYGEGGAACWNVVLEQKETGN